MEEKKYLDLDGLKYYDKELKSHIDSLVGELKEFLYGKEEEDKSKDPQN